MKKAAIIDILKGFFEPFALLAFLLLLFTVGMLLGTGILWLFFYPLQLLFGA